MRRESLQAAIRVVARWLKEADALVVAAGAGMGVDSGLPDFRGEDGFWHNYPALKKLGIDFFSIASPKAFLENPYLAWGFYGHRLKLYRTTSPHKGFKILLNLALQLPHGARVFTSNVDGHFERSGFLERHVYACHGSIHFLQCTVPCRNEIWSAECFEPDIDQEACLLRGELPLCPFCGALARPNVLMFDDVAWVNPNEYRRSELDRWLRSTSRPLVLEIGAGVAVPTVRHFSHHVARNFGGKLVRINPGESAVPAGLGFGLEMGGLAALNAISQELGFKDPD